METERNTASRVGEFAVGRWSGATLYLSGVVGFDVRLGRVVEGYSDLDTVDAERLASGHASIDFREGPIVAQAWVAYSHIDEVLRSEGLGFRNVVKITHFLTDFTDFPAYMRVRRLFLGDDPPPSTVVEVTQLLPSPATRLEVDVIASATDAVDLGAVGPGWGARQATGHTTA